MSALVGIGLKILLGGGIGYAARRGGMVGDRFGAQINALLLAVVAPAAIIASASSTRFSPDLAGDLGTGAAIAAIYFAVAWAGLAPASRILPLPRDERHMMVNLSVMPNTGFVGFPVAYEMFGPQGLLCAAAVDLVYNLVAYTVGLRWLTSSHPPRPREMLRNSPLLASVCAIVLFFSPVHLPGVVTEAVGMVGAMMTPLAMMILGISLAESSLPDLWRNTWGYLACGLRLVVLPAAVWAGLRFAGVGGLAAQVAVVSLAMPSGTLNAILGGRYDVGYRFAVHTVVQSNVLMFVTLPMVLLLPRVPGASG
jgi:predicted permease